MNNLSSIPKPKFHGIVPPMVTPLSDQDTLDVAGLERLIEHLIVGGVHGLFILGTTGEGPSLAYSLRRTLIERVTRQVAGRVPVLVGITDTAFSESIHLSHHAAEAGAAGVVAAPPYYFPNSQSELLEYFRRLSSELPLPLYLYNMPSHTKTLLSPETVRRLAEVPAIAGIKDSSGDMIYLHQLLGFKKLRPDWTFLVGPEELLGEAVLLGADGGVCGGANLFPSLYRGLYDAAQSGQVQKVRDLHGRVMAISKAIYQIGHNGSSFLKGLKCSLRELEICDDYLQEPFHRFLDAERLLIRKNLQELTVFLEQRF